MKKVISLLIVLFLAIFIENCSFAYSTDDKDIIVCKSITKVASTNLEDDIGDLNKYANTNGGNLGKLEDKAGQLLGMIRAVGIVLSVGVLMVVGIKYMIASVEEKAEYKKTFLAYIIGAFMLFAATTLPEIIYTMVKDL